MASVNTAAVLEGLKKIGEDVVVHGSKIAGDGLQQSGRHVKTAIVEITPFLQNLLQVAGHETLLCREAAVEWLRQPENIQKLAKAGVSFAAVQFVSWAVGFGPAGHGLVAGRLASAYQSCRYGAFTPVGVFSGLQSMAMKGTLGAITTGASAAAALATLGTDLWQGKGQ